jgi:hypothetical protein
MIPSTEQYSNERFFTFDAFYGCSETLNAVLAPAGQRLYSPAAALVKRQAQRHDIPFADLIQAELLILMMTFITPGTRWYPQTLHYALYVQGFPFFVRASQHKNFTKLAIITGIDDADKLRLAVKDGHERLNVAQWHDFHFERNFWTSMNMEKLDTLN